MALTNPRDFAHTTTILGDRDGAVDQGRYKKRFPKGINLQPDHTDHKKLLEFLLEMGQSSSISMQKRFPSWKAVDEKLTAYIKLDDEEKGVKNIDSRKPTSMVVPMGFATLETLMAYNIGAFLTDPVFRYEPKGPEDTLGQLLLEMYVNQAILDPLSRSTLNLYTTLRDSIVYGFGASVVDWTRKPGFKTTRKGTETFREDIDLFQGPTITAFDSYNVLPDTSVPITEIEQMESFGWLARKNLSFWLSKEEQDETLFNFQYLRKTAIGKSVLFKNESTQTGRSSKTGVTEQRDVSPYKHIVDMMFYYVWIIPREFNLSDESYPRLWKFGVAGDRVITQAHEVERNHNRIPIACLAPTGDQHTILPVSLLEIDHPMQEAMDWIWSSHVSNVRKLVHNMLVVDPEIINIEDVTDTTWGMVARVRPSHWGRGVKDGVMQLPVSDATRNHPNDVAFMMDLSNRVMGTSDQSQGIQQRRGERVSASEAENTTSFLMSRLQTRAALQHMQGFSDMAFMCASDVNQFLEDETFIRNVGELSQVLALEYGMKEDFIKVNPGKIDLTATVRVNDGSTPRADTAKLGLKLLEVAKSDPKLIQQLDSVKLFLHIARNAGFKNPEKFLNINSRILSGKEESALGNSVQQGNTVPTQEFIDAERSAA